MRRVRSMPAWPALLAITGLAVALAAQVSLDRHRGAWFDGLVLYIVAVGLWWLALRDEPEPATDTTPIGPSPRMDGRRRAWLTLGAGLVLFTTVGMPLVMARGPAPLADLAGHLAVLRYPDGPTSPTNTFTFVGLVTWLLGLGLVSWALADREPLLTRFRQLRGMARLELSVSRVGLAVLAIMLLAAYLRLHDLGSVPLEMTSDHTEKLLDVSDVVGGLRPVYLPRNAGREPLEFYWIGLLVWMGLPLSYATLKTGMGVVSILTIPVIYWLGRVAADREVGLLAALVMALSPWHIQITRIGLRIAWSPLFVALCLALLYAALRSGGRNAWLALGACVGAGMYGYSGFRPMAFVVVAAVALKLAHDASMARRHAAGGASTDGGGGSRGRDDHGEAEEGGVPEAEESATHATDGPRWLPLGEHIAAAAGVSLIIAAPLVRFALDQPGAFWARTMTRATGAEVALAHPAWKQLLVNWRQALLMFNYTSDTAWFQSPPGRPALETVTGALFVLGVVTAVYRLRRGGWRSPILLVALPVMLVASVLALAFPDEVPHLSRAAGALPIAVVLIALPLPILANRLRRALGEASSAAYLLILAILFVWAGRVTWQRYFVEYRHAYDQATHPTSEGAAMARGFVDLGGDLDHIYLVGWPHGWDYRAVGAHLGALHWNGLLWGAAADGSDAVTVADEHADDPAPKLYFVGGGRAPENIDHLRQLYPTAWVAEHQSERTGKAFWTVFVPGSG